MNAQRLFLTGFLILFLELSCIRWFGARVVFLQFFTNIALLAAFLGMSLGCMCATSKTNWLPRFSRIFVWIIGLTLILEGLYTRWSGLVVDVGSDVVFFGTEFRKPDLAQFVVPLELIAAFFFVTIALSFIGPGQVLGRCFDACTDRVAAYSWNIGGSLAGIAAFSLLSYLTAPPVVWFGLSFALVALLLRQDGQLDRAQWIFLAASLGLVLYGDLRGSPEVRWSPYYSVEYRAESRGIWVNTIRHQNMLPLDGRSGQYALPYRLQERTGRGPFERVLVIGAGSGNDVSHALRSGARHVDAVEIDPVIQELGARYHPNQPYSDPRVHLHLDDGRSFLPRSDAEYDLIVYALVDSLILHSSYSSVRLESFLFTREAFADIRDRLGEDGVFITYNFFRRGWIVTRITQMLRETFGHDPLVLSVPHRATIGDDDILDGSLTVIMAGATEHIQKSLEGSAYDFRLHDPYADATGGGAAPDDRLTPVDVGASTLPPSTDDWPYLYVREPTLPPLYLRSLLLVGVLGLGLLYRLSPTRRVTLNGRMFFLGAAFMLLETKAVVQLALLFGSTWSVNSMVFFVILTMILAANLYVLRRPKTPIALHYVGLFLLLGLNYVVPLDSFLGLEAPLRQIAPAVLALAPIFFAGVVFALSFARSAHPDRDFGANVAGAVVGGLAEYASMALGFNSLLLVVLAFYALSACFRMGSTPAAAPA